MAVAHDQRLQPASHRGINGHARTIFSRKSAHSLSFQFDSKQAENPCEFVARKTRNPGFPLYERAIRHHALAIMQPNTCLGGAACSLSLVLGQALRVAQGRHDLFVGAFPAPLEVATSTAMRVSDRWAHGRSGPWGRKKTWNDRQKNPPVANHNGDQCGEMSICLLVCKSTMHHHASLRGTHTYSRAYCGLQGHTYTVAFILLFRGTFSCLGSTA